MPCTSIDSICHIANSTNIAQNYVIPQCIGNITSLSVFSIYNSSASGALPLSICNLINITKLDIGNNILSGSLHGCIFEMPHIVHIIASDNKFTGSLDVEVINLVNLTFLVLANNKLKGQFPPIKIANKLKHFIIQNNGFEGLLTRIFLNKYNNYSYDKLNMTQLKGFYIESNNFYDNNIASLLSLLLNNNSNIEGLNVANNGKLKGSIPHFNTKYVLKLSLFSISNCDISGRIPSNVYLNNITYLMLFNNRISCKIPNNFTNTMYVNKSVILLGNLFTDYSQTFPLWMNESSPLNQL